MWIKAQKPSSMRIETIIYWGFCGNGSHYLWTKTQKQKVYSFLSKSLLLSMVHLLCIMYWESYDALDSCGYPTKFISNTCTLPSEIKIKTRFKCSCIGLKWRAKTKKKQKPFFFTSHFFHQIPHFFYLVLNQERGELQ